MKIIFKICTRKSFTEMENEAQIADNKVITFSPTMEGKDCILEIITDHNIEKHSIIIPTSRFSPP